MSATGTWKSSAFANGRFVAVSDTSGTSAYSVDGINWVAMTGLASATFNSVAAGAISSTTYYVTVAGSTATTVAYYSTNGTSWTAMTGLQSGTYTSVRYGNGRFVATSSLYTYSAYSFDGITWTASAMQVQADSLTYGQGVFLALKTGSSTGYTSEDGIMWRARSVTSTTYTNATFGYTSTNYTGVFVTVGSTANGTNISAGTRTKGRAIVNTGQITQMNLFEPNHQRYSRFHQNFLHLYKFSHW